MKINDGIAIRMSDDPRQDLVDPTAQRRREQTRKRADHERQAGDHDGDADRVARTVDKPRQHIAADIVRSEQELAAPGLVQFSDDLCLAKWREQGCQQRNQRIKDDDHEAELRRPRGLPVHFEGSVRDDFTDRRGPSDDLEVLSHVTNIIVGEVTGDC